MISVNDLRTGVTIQIDGELFSVVEFLHVKPGKGAAFVRTKLRNIETGNVFERTFRAGERVNRARIESRGMQYLYNDGEGYHFMDSTTYEQVMVSADLLGDATDLLKESSTIQLQFHDGRAIGVELPTHVELEVTDTEPGFKGDTATGGNKPATVETGFVVQVPLFIETGDVIRIDTRTKEYLSRV